MGSELLFNATDEFEFVTEAMVVFDQDMSQVWDLDGANDDLADWYNSTLDAPTARLLKERLGNLAEPIGDAIWQMMSQDSCPDEFALFVYPMTHGTGLIYGIWVAPSEDGFGLDPERRQSVLNEMKQLRHQQHKRHLEFQPRRYEAP